MDDRFLAVLFSDDGENTYAIIDGASCEELLGKLNEFRPEHICLYAGELEPGVEEVAPYLVELLPDHPFTEWLLDEGFGKHWGIFARSALGMRGLRKHFRSFLLVKDPQGKTLYFRYYDPRVLLIFLPTCNRKELTQFFGPVTGYAAEEASTGDILWWSVTDGKLQRRSLASVKS